MAKQKKQPVAFLTKELYLENAQRNAGGHWAKATDRWVYHSKAVEVVKEFPPTSSQAVLEMGTMGASLVVGSHAIDFDSNWPSQIARPKYFHDARSIPWPIADKQYEWFIALRVFQHLVPKQQECFAEAKRIAKNVLLVIPPAYPEKILGKLPAGGLTIEQLTSWNNGKKPSRTIDLGGWMGFLYYWNEKDFG